MGAHCNRRGSNGFRRARPNAEAIQSNVHLPDSIDLRDTLGKYLQILDIKGFFPRIADPKLIFRR